MIKINPKNYISENIISEEELIKKLVELRKQGKKIGLCTGSFDLLHPGHIAHLISAKKACDVLVVAIARDNYSSKTRGKGRPIFSQYLRAFMVSQLKSVDFVIFDDRLDKINRVIKPDVYIKGRDYSDGREKLQEEIVSSYGGKIYYTPTEKLSTTKIIRYIKEEVL